MAHVDPPDQARWRKSSYSGGGGDTGGDCVETATLPDGRIAFRDSKCPDRAVLRFTRTRAASWLRSLAAGDAEAPLG
ncbi:DUF397 domain-containing protein [Streptomyces sp. NPDC093085]|uniref:DUF397 domain-containing protein n=1 Tax=Streptomyces sp. NPDC093085 TaxID=3155068 RepID=UPI00344840AD